MNIKRVLVGVSAFLFVLICIIFGLYIFRSVSLQPQNVQISNITAHSFTVSWESKDRQVGLVSIGKGGTFPLMNADTLIFYDDRDLSRAELLTFKETGDVDSVKVEDLKEYYTHHVTVTNLDPETTYEFSLGNKLVLRPHGVLVQTQQEIDTINTPKPSYGLLFEKDDLPASDTIVYVTVEDSSRYSTQLSAVTREDGSWYIDISNLTDRDDLTKLSLTDSYSINLSFLNHNYGRTIDITIPGTLDAPVRNIRLADLSTISLGSNRTIINNSIPDNMSLETIDLVYKTSAGVDEICTNCNLGIYQRVCEGSGTSQCCYGTCVLVPQEDDSGSDDLYDDSDSDGIINNYDECAETEPGVEVSQSGCPIEDDDRCSVNNASCDPNDANPSPTPSTDEDQNDSQDDQGSEESTSDDNSTTEDERSDDEDKTWDVDKKADNDGEPPDSDGDGIPDYQDRCGDTDRGEYVNAYGCPTSEQQQQNDSYDDRDLDGKNDKYEAPQNCLPTQATSGQNDCAYCPIGQEIVREGITLRCFYNQRLGYYWEEVPKNSSVALPTISMNDICDQEGGCYCRIESTDDSETVYKRIAYNVRCTRENLASSPLKISNRSYAQSGPTYYSPSEGVVIFEESGLYCTNYLDQEYCFEVNDREDKIVYIDVDSSGSYTEGDINLASDVTEISFQKESDSALYSLERGFSFLSFDLYSNELSDAHSFLAEINRSTEQGILSIATFQNGKWVVVGVRGDTIIGQNNFPIAPGRGYLIKTKRPLSFSIYGNAVTSPVPISIQEGWNLVGISGTNKTYTAESLIESINSTKTSVDNVTRWTASKARYEGLQKNISENGTPQVYGFDFPITARTAYFIRNTEESLIWTP